MVEDIERAVVLDEIDLAFLQNFDSSLSDIDISVEPTTLRGDHVAGAITDETTNHDLTVLGATRGLFLKQNSSGQLRGRRTSGCEIRYSDA